MKTLKNTYIITCVISLLAASCSKEELESNLRNEAAMQAASGFYTGTLIWRKDNPATGETERGSDAQATLEIRRLDDERVTFYLTTGVNLSNRVIISRLLSKTESGSGTNYAGEFTFGFGDPDLPANGKFGYFNQTRVFIGQQPRLSFFNYTKPNVINAETLVMEAFKR